jgi:hypothetical protein
LIFFSQVKSVGKKIGIIEGRIVFYSNNVSYGHACFESKEWILKLYDFING